MNMQCALIYSLISTVPFPLPLPSVVSQTIEVQRFGLYVLVDDVERSVAFYAALFGKEPQVRTPALVGFDVAGGLFGIVDRTSYPNSGSVNSSVRPYMKVADLDGAFARAKALAGDRIEAPGIVTEGDFRFFRFTDPDGNMLELFSLQPPKE